jgi:hypothetical protein
VSGATLGDDVVGSPVVTVEDGRGGARLASEDLDGDDLCLLGDTVGPGSDGACDVGTVADGVDVLASDGVVCAVLIPVSTT